MPNKKLTKAGGKEYSYTYTQTTPGTSLEVCNEDAPYGMYRGTGMAPTMNDGYAAKISPNPTYAPWEDDSRLAKKPK